MAMGSIIERSTISTKLLIALTGLALFLYLIVHLGGNLLILAGPGTFNAYAAALMSQPALILPIEIGLAAIFIIHIYKTVTMWWANRKARPQGYHQKKWAGDPSRKSVASSTMIYTGIFTLVFVILHVRAFRFGAPHHDAAGRMDLFSVVTGVFSNPGWVVFYEVALVVLGLHLWHGFSSAFESLGIHPSPSNAGIVRLGKLLAIVIAGGFLLLPIWVYFFGGRP